MTAIQSEKPEKVAMPRDGAPCHVWFNGRMYSAFVCAIYQNRVGVTFFRGGREQLRILPWKLAPATIPRGTPAFAWGAESGGVAAKVQDPETCAHEDVALECPFCARAVDPDTGVCAQCRRMVAPKRVCVYCDEEVPA